jgi:hypothetical protein
VKSTHTTRNVVIIIVALLIIVPIAIAFTTGLESGLTSAGGKSTESLVASSSTAVQTPSASSISASAGSVITVDQISQDYQNNQYSANQEYQGKMIEVTGFTFGGPIYDASSGVYEVDIFGFSDTSIYAVVAVISPSDPRLSSLNGYETIVAKGTCECLSPYQSYIILLDNAQIISTEANTTTTDLPAMATSTLESSSSFTSAATTTSGEAGTYLRSSAGAFAVSSSAGCTLQNVGTGDVVFAVVQSSGVAQSTIHANDTGGDTYAYATNWGVGVGAAYARASSGGTISVTVAVGETAGLSLFCYDIAGVTTEVSNSSGQGSGQSLSVAPMNNMADDFVVGIYASFGSTITFQAGFGFSLTDGTPIGSLSSNYVGSEYGVEASSTTACPMTTSTSQGWAGMCFVFQSSG